MVLGNLRVKETTLIVTVKILLQTAAKQVLRPFNNMLLLPSLQEEAGRRLKNLMQYII